MAALSHVVAGASQLPARADESRCPDPEECHSTSSESDDSEPCFGCLALLQGLPECFLLLNLATILSGLSMLFVQIPLLQNICSMRDTPASILFFTVVSVYGLTIALGWYIAVADAGHMSERSLQNNQAPPRSRNRLRRFDHDDDSWWLGNSIALLNHREFMLMITFMSLIAVFSTVVDTILIVQSVVDAIWIVQSYFHHQPGGGDINLIWKLPAIVVHLLWSLFLCLWFLPILHRHVRLISRNELTEETGRHLRMKQDKCGRTDVPSYDLSDDEFHEANAGEFYYAPELNPYDQGWPSNCVTFWCTARWSLFKEEGTPEDLGAF